MSQFNSALDRLSVSQAASDYLCLPDGPESDISFSEAYYIACKGVNALDEKDISVWGDIQDWSDEDLKNNIIDRQNSISETMREYAEYAKKGIIILTADFHIDGDVNSWDMECLATIGYNTSLSQNIDNKKVIFSGSELKWRSDDGSVYDFSRDTGLPTKA